MTYFEYRLEIDEGCLVHHVALEFGHAFYFSITGKSYFGWGYFYSLSLSLSLSLYIYIYIYIYTHTYIYTLLSNVLNILVKDSNKNSLCFY